ncbi:MAG: histidine phosphatase family protein [Acidobacteria bacterium]|nr:histidine phosphatase family protein [Acidobacteriota bacterium]
MSSAPKRMVRLFLVRHGETADNIHMRYLGISDVPLTAAGKRQARRAASALSKLPIRSIISSPMRRAAETAAIIHSACGVDLRLDARLAEGSFGNWEGRTRAEVLGLGPRDAELLARWESDPGCAPPGGESIESIQKRVTSLVEDLTDEFQDASVVLVSHVGPIKALLAAVLDIPLQSTRRLFLDPGTISVVEWGAHPLLRLFNSHAHLGWASARWMR